MLEIAKRLLNLLGLGAVDSTMVSKSGWGALATRFCVWCCACSMSNGEAMVCRRVPSMRRQKKVALLW